MVGNDATEDMIVSKLGIETFLLTDYLINTENLDISSFRPGGWEDLIKLVNELPCLK